MPPIIVPISFMISPICFLPARSALVVGSVHGSGSGQGVDSALAPIYGGAAAGFMITFQNGWAVYFPGSASENPCSAAEASWPPKTLRSPCVQRCEWTGSPS